jgi:hypothetical protein
MPKKGTAHRVVKTTETKMKVGMKLFFLSSSSSKKLLHSLLFFITAEIQLFFFLQEGVLLVIFSLMERPGAPRSLVDARD